MKKALAMALGAMLVAGSAVPASAKSQVDFSGMYRVMFMNHWNQNYGVDKEGGYVDDPTSDNYFMNRLQMDFGFHATDEVSVYWRLRGPSKGRWGTSSNNTLTSYWHYGEITQDWGTLSIGRLKDPYTDFGLASLGYAPDGSDNIFSNRLPFDFDDATDGIRYANRWDNGFQLAAAFLRLAEVVGATTPYPTQYKIKPTDPTGTPVAIENRDRSETADLFAIEPAFFWDGGGASLGLHYLRDHVSLGADKPALKAFFINPAFVQSWGDFSTHFEGKAGWGKADDPTSGESIKASGYAFYLDFDYNYGPGNVNLAGWWASGASDNTDDDAKDLVDFGVFAPLAVAYGNYYTSDRNWWPTNAIAEANERSGPIGKSFSDMANHWAIDLNGAHAFTDDLTMTYALAYLALNKTREGAKKGIGFETDLGFQVQLLDNLQFSTVFGYLFAGDALKDPATDEKAKASYNWYNTLTFSF